MFQFYKPAWILVIFLCPILIPAQTTFLNTYGTSANEAGHCIAKLPDGNFAIGGYKQDSSMLLKVDPDGNFLSQQCYRVLPTSNEQIIHIFVDRDGFLVGTGQGGGSATGWSYVFKYNPISSSMEWLKVSAQNANFIYITEGPGMSDYILSGQTSYNGFPGSGDDAYLARIDRNTGAISTLSSNYHLGSAETINATMLVNDTIYAAGRYNKFNGGFSGMRFSFSKFDLLGNEISSHLLFRNVSSNARMYFGAMLLDGDSLLLISGGNLTSIAPVYNTYLTKMSKNGGISWGKGYTFSGFSAARLIQVEKVPGGYLAAGHTQGGGNDLLLLKMDPTGNVLWCKRYGGSGFEGFMRSNAMVIDSPSIYLVGRTTSLGAGGTDVILLKTDANGAIGGACPFENNQAVVVSNLSSVYRGPESLTQFAETDSIVSVSTPLRLASPQHIQHCNAIIFDREDLEINADWSTVSPGNVEFKWSVSKPVDVASFMLETKLDNEFVNLNASYQDDERMGFGNFIAIHRELRKDSVLLYRLRTENWNGQVSYSKIVCLTQENSAPLGLMVIYPAAPGQIELQISTRDAGVSRIRLLSPTGQVVWETQMQLIAGVQHAKLNPAVTPGIYFLQVTEKIFGKAATVPIQIR